MKPLALLTLALLGLGLLVIYACQDAPDVTEPSTSVAASTAATTGRWAPVFTTPSVAVHVHLLRTGKVLLWGDQKGAYLWSASAGFTPAAPKPFRIYCTGHTFLSDGRLLVMGGTSPGTRGLRYATIFDPSTKTWSATASMAQGRYYPTATTLPNGDVLVMSGHDTARAVVRIPEVRSGSGWRRLTTAPLAIANPFYPAMFVAPNGKVFLAGFTPTSAYLDVTGTGQWSPVDKREVVGRKLGSAVMYAPGKILYVGGGVDSVLARDTLFPPTASAEVIDLNQSAPAWRTVPPMAFPRRQLNATILADGSVLVTGGTRGAGFNNQAAAVRAAELWNPKTESWTTMASESRNRTYHSSAILLPNGRVLSTGSGEGGGIAFAQQRALGASVHPALPVQGRWQPCPPAEHHLGAVAPLLPTVVHDPDAERGVHQPGHLDPAVLGHPWVQPEPAPLSSSREGDQLHAPSPAWPRRGAPWRRPDRTCCS